VTVTILPKPADVLPAAALPTNPRDGQEAIITPQAGRYWKFMWMTNAWFFIGGGALESVENNAVAVPAAWAPYTPRLTVPRAGRYIVEYVWDGATNVAPMQISALITSGAGDSTVWNLGLAAANMVFNGIISYDVIVGGPGDIYPQMANGGGAGAITCYHRSLKITPLYVT
jgi:hypothetical protein